MIVFALSPWQVLLPPVTRRAPECCGMTHSGDTLSVRNKIALVWVYAADAGAYRAVSFC